MIQTTFHAKDGLVSPVFKGLKIRIRKVTILNEKDCIKVKQKWGFDKKDWVEIHYSLRVLGHAWLANGKDSCWIKMNHLGLIASPFILKLERTGDVLSYEPPYVG
ncbi:MAG TPA: hypothetical protein VHA09_06675 [Nitrososphaera sp.]|nr:hypothetical protein [Nitrososphaera sp.]